MKTLAEAALVFMFVCAFSSCSKESGRPVEAGTGNNGNNGNTATVVTGSNTKCDTTITSTLKRAESTEKHEFKQSEEFESETSTSDKGINAVIEITGRVLQDEKKLNSDGTKTDFDAFAYSYERTSNLNIKEIKKHTFLETEVIKGLKTAGEGYFFKVDGKEVKTKKIDIKWETEIFVDGKNEKILSQKKNGEDVPPPEGKYKSEEKTEGDVKVLTETLEEPFTPAATPNERIESSVKVCRYKKTK